MPDEKGRIRTGWSVVGNKREPANTVTWQKAKDILNKLIVENIPKNGVEFPKSVVFRFHGNEKIEIFEIESVEPKLRPIVTTDQAVFS